MATCKASKPKLHIPGKTTWNAEKLGKDLLAKIVGNRWGVPCKIISDCDKKFVSDRWRAMYKELKVDLLYSTELHLQTCEQSKRTTTQTVEIKFRYFPIKLPD